MLCRCIRRILPAWVSDPCVEHDDWGALVLRDLHAPHTDAAQHRPKPLVVWLDTSSQVMLCQNVNSSRVPLSSSFRVESPTQLMMWFRYDINCQFKRHFQRWLETESELPADVKDAAARIEWPLPAWHHGMHKAECQEKIDHRESRPGPLCC